MKMRTVVYMRNTPITTATVSGESHQRSVRRVRAEMAARPEPATVDGAGDVVVIIIDSDRWRVQESDQLRDREGHDPLAMATERPSAARRDAPPLSNGTADGADNPRYASTPSQVKD